MANRRQFIQQTLALALMETLAPFSRGTTVAANYLGSLPKGAPGFMIPPDWKLYEIAGQILFPIYHESGSLSTKQVCYLIRPKLLKRGYFRQETKWDNGELGRGSASLWGWEAVAIGFNDMEFMAVGDDEEAIKRLVNMKINRARALGKPVEVDMNGGSLPLPQEENYVPTR